MRPLLHEPARDSRDRGQRVELVDFVHLGDGTGDKVFVYAVPTPDGGADCIEVTRPGDWARTRDARRHWCGEVWPESIRQVGRRDPRG